MQSPTTDRLSAVKKILRYIKGTLQDLLALTPIPIQTGQGHHLTNSSGYVISIGANHISASLSWISQLLRDLHIPLLQARVLHCDNKSAIAIACNPVLHAKTKHIEVDYHYVRDKLLSNYSISHTSAVQTRLLVRSLKRCLQTDSATYKASFQLIHHFGLRGAGRHMECQVKHQLVITNLVKSTVVCILLPLV